MSSGQCVGRPSSPVLTPLWIAGLVDLSSLFQMQKHYKCQNSKQKTELGGFPTHGPGKRESLAIRCQMGESREGGCSLEPLLTFPTTTYFYGVSFYNFPGRGPLSFLHLLARLGASQTRTLKWPHAAPYRAIQNGHLNKMNKSPSAQERKKERKKEKRETRASGRARACVRAVNHNRYQ